jgi:hypothetical protein
LEPASLSQAFSSRLGFKELGLAHFSSLDDIFLEAIKISSGQALERPAWLPTFSQAQWNWAWTKGVRDSGRHAQVDQRAVDILAIR